MSQSKSEPKSPPQPSKVYRGTIEEVLSHRDEIPADATVELKVFESVKETPTMKLLRQWMEEDATDDPEEIRAADEAFLKFQRSINQTRRERGAEILYPEAE